MSVLFTSVPAKRLSQNISASATSFKLNNILGWNGSALTAADFGTQAYAIFRDTTGTLMEIMEIDPATIASASITILRRGLKFSGDLTTEVSANKLTWVKGTTIVELGSCSPQDLQYLKEYVDSVSIAGVADASTTVRGIVEIATQAEIDADTAAGGTGAKLAIDPQTLAASKYGTRLPSANQKTFLGAVVGTILAYAGLSTPSGFLDCDGTIFDMDTYGDLADVLRGYYGVGTGVTVTGDAGTDTLTATAHGLTAGNRLVFKNVGGGLPGGIAANTVYFVVNPTTNTFQLSLTSGGAAIDITSAGTGVHSYYNSVRTPDLRSSFPLGMGQRVRTFTFDAASDVDPATDIITVESNSTLYTGTAVVLTGTTVPTGLTTATTYYVIRLSATTIKLATTRIDSTNGSAINITADGAGLCTLTQTLTSRTLGDTGGEEDHTISYPELPEGVRGPGSNDSGDDADNSYGNSAAASVPHNIMSPFTTVHYIIKT
jgi:hypothetical protein